MLAVVIVVIVVVASLTGEYPSKRKFTVDTSEDWVTAEYNETETQDENLVLGAIGQFAPKRDGAVDRTGKIKPKWSIG